MIVDRRPEEMSHYTTILIYPNGISARWNAHQVSCARFDYDPESNTRNPPTAHVHLLGTGNGLHYEDVQRLADDYAVIADIAMRLEAEMRAAYEVTYGTPPASV